MISVNKETFEEEVLKYKGKVVVEFWSETCQPCKELLPGVEALSKKYNKMLKMTVVVAIMTMRIKREHDIA